MGLSALKTELRFLRKEERNQRRFRNQEELKRSAFVYIKGFYDLAFGQRDTHQQGWSGSRVGQHFY